MKTLQDNWWIIALQGLFILTVGALALLYQEIDLNALIQYLGLIFLGFGVILGLWGLRSRTRGRHWIFMFVFGVLQAALGLVILAYPSNSSAIFTIMIGGWALVMAATQLVLGFINKNSRVLFFINALISAGFGSIIIWYDFKSQHALTLMVGIYSIILGITIIYYSIKMKIWGNGKHANNSRQELESVDQKGSVSS